MNYCMEPSHVNNFAARLFYLARVHRQLPTQEGGSPPRVVSALRVLRQCASPEPNLLGLWPCGWPLLVF